MSASNAHMLAAEAAHRPVQQTTTPAAIDFNTLLTALPKPLQSSLTPRNATGTSGKSKGQNKAAGSAAAVAAPLQHRDRARKERSAAFRDNVLRFAKWVDSSRNNRGLGIGSQRSDTRLDLTTKLAASTPGLQLNQLISHFHPTSKFEETVSWECQEAQSLPSSKRARTYETEKQSGNASSRKSSRSKTSGIQSFMKESQLLSTQSNGSESASQQTPSQPQSSRSQESPAGHLESQQPNEIASKILETSSRPRRPACVSGEARQKVEVKSASIGSDDKHTDESCVRNPWIGELDLAHQHEEPDDFIQDDEVAKAIDPSQIKRQRSLINMDNLLLPHGKHGLDQDSQEFSGHQQSSLIKRIFADDRAALEFAALKRSFEHDEGPSKEDITLPGWNSWCGPGTRPRRRFFKQKPGVAKELRQDAGKDRVIISEKRSRRADAYQPDRLSFPLTSRSQHEHHMSCSMAPEVTTSSQHRHMVRPTILLKPGSLIRPIDVPI